MEWSSTPTCESVGFGALKRLESHAFPCVSDAFSAPKELRSAPKRLVFQHATGVEAGRRFLSASPHLQHLVRLGGEALQRGHGLAQVGGEAHQGPVGLAIQGPELQEVAVEEGAGTPGPVLKRELGV